MSETPIHDATVTADEFDITAWLEGASAPEKRVTIFQRGDLLAEIAEMEDDLARLTPNDGESSQEMSLDEEDETATLVERIRAAKETLYRTALTLVVRAVSVEREQEIREQFYGKDVEKMTDAQKVTAYRAYSLALTAEAVIGRIDADGARHDLTMSAEQMKALVSKVGAAQETAIGEAVAASRNEAPKVDTDFLHKR